jgi:hypothetical protein
MISRALRQKPYRNPIATLCARALLLAVLAITGSLLVSRDASASAAMAAAAESASAGLSGCSNNAGKALYECVANVLDKLANNIPDKDVALTRGALQTAASKLRAAVNKAQALSAISQCRALIAGALAKVRAIGGGHVEGWGGGSGAGIGLEAIVGTLSRAAKLIQAKG